MDDQLNLFGGKTRIILTERKKTLEEQFRKVFGYDQENVCELCFRFSDERCRLRGKSRVSKNSIACTKYNQE